MSINVEAAEWPSHTEELSRKLNEQLQRRVNAHTNGILSDRELYIVVSFAWDLCAGLVFESDLRTVEQVHAALRAQLRTKK
jgi:hypothetical protein